MPRRQPITESVIASWPLPLSRSSCDGSKAIELSGLGVPKRVVGMKSMNIWVIAMEIIIIDEYNALILSKGNNASKATETKFICMPGIRPVKIPMIMPDNDANRISRIICCNIFKLLIYLTSLKAKILQ